MEDRLFEECTNLIGLVQIHILKKKCNDEAKTFFMKVIADNHRYIAEMSNGDRLSKALDDARQSYEQASLVNLAACNPIKLSVNLNMSVFFHEVLRDSTKAV